MIWCSSTTYFHLSSVWTTPRSCTHTHTHNSLLYPLPSPTPFSSEMFRFSSVISAHLSDYDHQCTEHLVRMKLCWGNWWEMRHTRCQPEILKHWKCVGFPKTGKEHQQNKKGERRYKQYWISMYWQWLLFNCDIRFDLTSVVFVWNIPVIRWTRICRTFSMIMCLADRRRRFRRL